MPLGHREGRQTARGCHRCQPCDGPQERVSRPLSSFAHILTESLLRQPGVRQGPLEGCTAFEVVDMSTVLQWPASGPLPLTNELGPLCDPSSTAGLGSNVSMPVPLRRILIVATIVIISLLYRAYKPVTSLAISQARSITTTLSRPIQPTPAVHAAPLAMSVKA